jgi:excisionase family DNA binding protein
MEAIMKFDLRPLKFLSAQELAKRMNCSEEAIRKRVRKGRLGIKLGGRCLISEEEASTMKVRRYLCKR